MSNKIKLNVTLLLVKSAPFIKKSAKEKMPEQILTGLSFQALENLPIRQENIKKLAGLVEHMSHKVNFNDIMVVDDDTNFQTISFGVADCLLVMSITGECQRVIAKFNQMQAIPTLFYSAELAPLHTMVAAFGTLKGEHYQFALNDKDAIDFLNVRYAYKKLKHATILMFGGTSTSVIDNQTTKEKLNEQFGVTIRTYSCHTLAERASHFDTQKVSARAVVLTDGATKIQHLVQDDFIRASQLSLALQEIATEENADAVAVECAEIYETCGAVPCVPLHDLDNIEITSACEGDLHCLILKMLLQYLSETPTFMGNFAPVNTEKNTFGIWHHSAPSNFFKDDKYDLETYGYRGVYFVTTTKVGSNVTVAKLSSDATTATLIKGNIESSSTFGNCVSMNIYTEHLDEYIHHHLLGNHHVVGYGHYTKPLQEVLALYGVHATVL